MIEQESKRDRAAILLMKEIDDAADGVGTGWGPIGGFVDLIIEAATDAARDALRAELDAGIATRAPRELAAVPVAPPPITCQCREPEAYWTPGAILCNGCGYKLDPGARENLPPRAEHRDFGPHICLCSWVNTIDGKTCLECGGEYMTPIEMPAPEPCPMCG